MPRAVILTALQLKFFAVCVHLTDVREETYFQGNVYEQGKFVTNGQAWEIGLVEAGAGNCGVAA